MQKPNDWDSVQPQQFGASTGLTAGPKICKIVKCYSGETKEYKEKIVFELDIASGEEKGYFSKLSEKLGEPKFAQVHQCTDGASTPYFKGRIKAIEESNQGFTFNFDEKSLVGKFVGCMFQIEEYINKNGEPREIAKPQWFFPVGKIAEQKTPAPKANNKAHGAPAELGTFSDGVPLPNEQDLPF